MDVSDIAVGETIILAGENVSMQVTIAVTQYSREDQNPI